MVPIDYTLTVEELKKKLRDVNGLYIPGDSQTLVNHGNLAFTNAVKQVLLWAQLHNEQNNSHFPIMGVGYGYLSMIRSQMKYPHKHLNEVTPQGKLQLNLAHDPSHTYIFDEYKKDDLES